LAVPIDSARGARELVFAMKRESEAIRRRCEERDYEEFLRRKVGASRASVRAGDALSNEAVEAEFAALRAKVTRSG
jgi:hypothetical protein